MEKNSKIFVAGHRGMVGSAIVRELRRQGYENLLLVSHDGSCALREAKHVLSLCRGLSFYGTVEGYRRHEKLDDEADDAMHRHGADHPSDGPLYVAERGGLL